MHLPIVAMTANAMWKETERSCLGGRDGRLPVQARHQRRGARKPWSSEWLEPQDSKGRTHGLIPP